LAFTLIEMLLVVMLVMVVMSLALGAWLGLREPSTETALRTLMSDLVRQAQQQSLATGRPVVLVVSTDANGGNPGITGISQTIVWSEDFDWNDEAGIAAHSDGTPAFTELDMGTAAYGWRSEPGRELLALPLADAKPAQLVHSARDGFYLECAIKPIALLDAGDDTVTIPLLLLKDADAGDEAVDDAIAGLELWRQPLYAFWPVTDDGPPKTCRYEWNPSRQEHWMLTGWIGERPEQPGNLDPDDLESDFVLNYSGIEWRDDWLNFADLADMALVRDFATFDSLQEPDYNPHTFAGGSWIRVGLLFDGSRLSLLRGGVIIDAFTPDEAIIDAIRARLQQVKDKGGKVSLWVGRHAVGTQPAITAQGTFDRCLLARVGTGQAIRLPQGVTTRIADDTVTPALHQRYIITAINGLATVAADPSLTGDQDGLLSFLRESDNGLLTYAIDATGTLRLQNAEPAP
jgi:type II secretory pathway pseudopilin PulG